MANEFNIRDLTAGRVLPPLPFPYAPTAERIAEEATGFEDAEVIQQGDGDMPLQTVFGTPMFFPLRLKLMSEPDSAFWLLPTEPMITVLGGNVVTRRNVAKSELRGTIKERWSTDDYVIDIAGMLTRHDEWNYPSEDVRKLRGICEAREPVDVLCPLFEHFGITRMVIEKYDFPFTKGPENQAYHISAFSDDEWSLFKKPL